MIRTPKFQSHLTVHIVPPDLLLVEDEFDHDALEGAAFPLVAPLIDGLNTAEVIADRLEGRVEVLDVHYALTLLEQHGYLVEADGGATTQAPNGTGVLVRGCGGVASRPLSAALEALGVSVVSQADFEVVAVDDYLCPELEAINRLALQASRAWMLVKPTGAVLRVGPLFRPGTTACWACLARRLRQNRPVLGFVATHGGRTLVAPSPPRSRQPGMQAAVDLAAAQTLRWLLDPERSELENVLVTLDVASMRTERHPVLRLPDCPECGDRDAPARRDPAVRLCSRPKLFVADGGYRTVLPEDTLENYRHHVSPLTGIVDSIRSVHRDDFTQLFVTSYGFPARLQDRAFLGTGLRAKSTGKGMHAAQARTSAFCEALERYSGVFRGDEPRQRASYRALQEEAIHPDFCQLISPAQYAAREAWNERNRDFNWIPRPFEEEREIEWTPVWSLTREQVRFVPTAYLYFGYPDDRDLFSRADSNGNAAGNTIEEAILQGFLELVERDCVAAWWYNRLRRPGVELDSFEVPFFRAVQEYYRELRRSIAVLDVTHDFGIPAFAAVSTGPGRTDPEDVVVGFGAHFDPTVGIARALTEMNQFLPTARKGSPLRVASSPVMGQDFLEPSPDLPARRRQDFAWTETRDLRDDVQECVRRTAERGMELLVLDQTRADCGLPVVKVLVPEMRPFWARFAAGRLYHVPVGMGWLAAPFSEEDLNPAHLII